jgi:RNA polymerase subunit RPABC4/transcription elongation factor Spt4
MIDSLPLDLFGEDEPEATPVPSDVAPAAAVTCPWCEAVVTPEAVTCPACGARISPSAPPAAPPHDGICQWCGATIAPDIDACPACGWDARGDNEAELPGLTTPLSDSEIRALYGDDAEEENADDTIFLVAEIISTLLPRG